MYQRQLRMVTTLVLGVALMSGAYFFGFQSGVSSVPEVDQVSGLTNKESAGAALSVGLPIAETADFSTFWRTWNILNQKFTPISTSTENTISNQTKMIGAIKGLVESHEDPYTIFFPPKETEIFKESVAGEFQGIGAVIGIADDGVLTVTHPLPGEPAERAGLKAGDKVLAIDGVPTEGLSLDESVKKIRGPEGTEVILTIASSADSASTDIMITRGLVTIPTVASAVKSKISDLVKKVVQKIKITQDQGVAQEQAEIEEKERVSEDFSVIALSAFSKTSADGFRKELEQFAAGGTHNLILDLRNNQGGFLEVAVDIASHFLPKDAVVIREWNANRGTEQVFVSKGYETLSRLEDLNIAILINKNTASAAEILGGALAEHGVALLVGENSFGKGSVQELIDITDTMSLKVTIARWYTPNGLSISGQGLTPDVAVEITPENMQNGTDPVLERAIELLLTGGSGTSS